MKSILVLIALMPLTCFAESFLCIPDAGATIIDGTTTPAKAMVLDMSRIRFVHTNEKGKWRLNYLGEEKSLFDKCPNENLCESQPGYGGTFYKQPDGRFVVTIILRDIERGLDIIDVAKGKCTKI